MHSEKIVTRCFYNKKLKLNEYISLTDEQYQHIVIVLRVKINSYISLFNQEDGEFIAQVTQINKHSVLVYLIKKIREYKQEILNLCLAYAPLKKNCNDFVIEKSTELGISHIVQIITDRTVNKPITTEKITQKCIMASQQCGRIDIPTIGPHISLQNFINNNKSSIIFWLNEDRSSIKLVDALAINHNSKPNIFLLVGPEGGFSNNEKQYLNSIDNIINVYLDTNILRAETAILAGLIIIKTKHNCL